MKNDILYLEADEEITAAIDKMLHLQANSLKIVVPKRSTLLQSVVNLKLLKKAADDAGKELILVTGDRTSTHLAARLGLAVAATLTSKPEIAKAAKPPESEAGDEIEEEDEPTSEVEPAIMNPEEEPSLPAGTGPGAGALNAAVPTNKPSYAQPMMVRKPVGSSSDAPVSAIGGTPKVPDFNKMQKGLLWGGLAVAAAVLLFIVNYFIAGATVSLFVQGSKIATNFTATLDPTIKVGDPVKATLAATNMSSNHDLTATVSATGKQDIGTKAGGTVTIKNCEDTSTHALPAGTVMTSQGKNFVTTAEVNIPGGSFSSGGKICSTSQSINAPVVATQNGDSYNLAPAGYTSPALTSNYVVQGSQMSGGVSKTVNVVTQTDIDKATADLLAKDKDSAQKDLENKVASGSRAITQSFTQTPGAVTSNPAVGAQADQVVVDVKVSYNELAVTNADLSNLLKAQAIQQVGSDNQIYDEGLSSLSITATKNNPGAASTFNFSATAYGGAKLDPNSIAKQLSGKRYGDATDIAGKLPGVSRVEVKLSPFWATKLPRITNHIKVVIKVAAEES
jgi:hypothetical protein